MENKTEAAVLYGIDVVVQSDGQTIIEWDTGYILGINMLDVYWNGVYLQKVDFTEKSTNSIEITGVTLKAGDVISIRYRPSTVNLGNIRVFPSKAAMMEVPAIRNTVAIVTNEKKFYIYGEFGWEEFVIPFTTQNVGMMFRYETISVTDVTQRTYSSQAVTYEPGLGNLVVFIDGEKVDSDNYVEVDNKTITFNTDLPTGSQNIEYMVASTDSWDETFSHSTEYTYYDDDSIHEEHILFNGNTVRYTEFVYDTYGNISRETVTRGAKTIIRDYTYDTRGNILKIDTAVS
jgi:YD repeat-containing protein